MQQINSDAPTVRRKAGMPRMKKANLKIDMTPMVDLGFLLISFFIYTTSISDPVVTKLNMPKESNIITKTSDLKSITFILDKQNKVYYYFGTEEELDAAKLTETTWEENSGFGKVIRDKQHQMDIQVKGSSNDLFVLIKSTPEASYESVVNALDEMLINKVSRYSLANTSAKEENLILLHQ